MKKNLIAILSLFATVSLFALIAVKVADKREQGASTTLEQLAEDSSRELIQVETEPSSQNEEDSSEEQTVLATLAPSTTDVPTQAPPAGGNSSGTQEPTPTTSEPSTLPPIILPREPVTIPKQNHDLGLIESVIRAAGFLYDKDQNIFYSDADPWQKNFGFTSVYDTFAKFGNMIYETERFKFSYGGRDWMFQVWKGRYGITSGAEMGIYYRELGSDVDFYHCADASKYVAMDFRLYKDNELYMFREPARHWWLTGFKLGDLINGNDFLMELTYYLDHAGMANALERAIANEGFVKGETYIRDGNNIRVFW